MTAEPKIPMRRACPICGKATVERYDPFCSKRCADVDLHRWMAGAYAVPAPEEEDESLLPRSPDDLGEE